MQKKNLHTLSSAVLEFPHFCFFNLFVAIRNCLADRTESMNGVLKNTVFAEFNWQQIRITTLGATNGSKNRALRSLYFYFASPDRLNLGFDNISFAA